MSEKLSERMKKKYTIEGIVCEPVYPHELTEIIKEVESLEAENQTLKGKADKWDTFYGQELHPNPVVQAECDRIENKELKSRLSEAEKLLESRQSTITEIHHERALALRKIEEAEKLVEKWRKESQSDEGSYKSIPDIGYNKCADELEKALRSEK